MIMMMVAIFYGAALGHALIGDDPLGAPFAIVDDKLMGPTMMALRWMNSRYGTMKDSYGP